MAQLIARGPREDWGWDMALAVAVVDGGGACVVDVRN